MTHCVILSTLEIVSNFFCLFSEEWNVEQVLQVASVSIKKAEYWLMSCQITSCLTLKFKCFWKIWLVKVNIHAFLTCAKLVSFALYCHCIILHVIALLTIIALSFLLRDGDTAYEHFGFLVSQIFSWRVVHRSSLNFNQKHWTLLRHF